MVDPTSPAPSTEVRPPGNRKGNQDPASGATEQAGDLLDNAGLQIPGVTKGGEEKDGSLKIKIHLNLHAKVRLDLDAKLYGDIVIGLL